MDEYIKEETSFFSLKAILKELKRHLIKIIAVIVAFAVIGGVYGMFFADLTYKTEASLIAIDDDVYLDENEEIDVIQRTASSAKAMITSASGNKVLEDAVKVLEDKGIKGLTVKGLKKELVVSISSMFILFTYETSNPDAQVILDTVISEFLKVLNEKNENGKYVMPMFGGKIKIFTTATEVKGEIKDLIISNTVLFAVIGAVLSIAVVVLLALLRQTFLDKESVEEELGIEILSVVEELSQDKKGGR